MNQQDELEKLIRKIDETTDGLGEWHEATEWLEWVRKEVQRILKDSRPHVVEAEAKTCDHCGRTMGDFAGGFGRMTRDGIHYNLCHPNDPRRTDCYHLVTTRSEAVGARRNTP